MASRTYSITALVVRHTKLGETDMIVTLLAEDGSQHKAVAKGARKPTSTFASRLELYSVANILLAEGKSLNIVKEAKLVQGNAAIRSDFVLSSAAAPLVELLAKATFEEQRTPRLFDLAVRSLSTLEKTENDPLIVSLAALLKALAFLGFRPTFQECVGCGAPIDLQTGVNLPFSYFDGGAVCSNCQAEHETTLLDANMLQWCNTLLYSTLDEVSTFNMPDQAIVRGFEFVNEWIKLHLGINMKSITFLKKNLFQQESR